MKARIFAVFAAFLLLILPVSLAVAQEIPHEADSLLSLYGETYITVRHHGATDLSRLQAMASLDYVSGDSARLNVNRQEFEKIMACGYGWHHTPLQRPADDDMMDPGSEQSDAWNTYPTYQGYDSLMNGFSQQYPQLCQTGQILTLGSGRKLLLVRLTSGLQPAGEKPLFLYTSSMHGDELTGYILMLRLTDHLLNGYGTDPEATWLLDHMEIWICPLANPDGTYYGGNHTVSGAVRRNGNHVDLNRNYKDPRVGDNPDGNPYQPETVAFMNFADTLPFTLAANLHGGAELVNYPWDTWTKLHPDNNWWIQVSRQYADTVQAFSPVGFFNDMNNGITNGAVWYMITGGRQDYMNYFAHCREVTLEVSNTKLPPANQLEAMWNYHHRALIQYLKDGWYGIRGKVTDSVTGLPLRAKVWINAHDADSSHVWSDPDHGMYFRPCFQGSYNVTWSAPGYHSRTQQVLVPFHDTTSVDIALVPVGFGVADPNNVSQELWYNALTQTLHLPAGSQAPGRVAIYGTDGRELFRMHSADSEIHVTLPAGVWLVRYTTPDGMMVVRKIASL